MNYTHEKVPYYASAVQWTGQNDKEVLALLNNRDTYATRYGLYQIMVRFSHPAEGQKMIDTLDAGSWIVTGENGQVKCYTDKQFNIKYREIL